MDSLLNASLSPDSTDIVEEPLPTRGELDFRLIELFFFAYREFTGDADSILERYGFGRAHHRILHFVNRDPGMTIAEILELLQITKQSLSRVLRQLMDDGFIAQVPGSDDRRQRRLYPTRKGRALTLELSQAQGRRIDAAFRAAALDDPRLVNDFLLEMGTDRKATRDWFSRKGIGKETPRT
ncbi:MarR family transcriptional regulator [Aureimonas sp. ME7]|uniref:MarR family winged helix-turn-helix transcriptional regulator n=1 Tax=Aureimonas sp. ME7 TaxID=2744252 RepID=UPI0015F7451A|nr:MarR family transcriptional regulator [Aureimonas sp. ME7]